MPDRKVREEHGLSRHPLYRKWQDIKHRCLKPTSPLFKYYGGNGVTICDEWRDSPKAFIDWALANGWVQGMEIDKDIKVSGNKVYSPETCSVVTHQVNMLAVVGRGSGRLSSKLKITENQVQDIIKAKANGDTSKELANQYSVDVCTINRIIRKNR